MRPAPLDELPIHQAPLSMARVATSDRHFYDRAYLNAHDATGDVFLVTGLGTYPNLGVRDAFACVRAGDTAWAVHLSDALDERSTEQRVGPYRIEVLEPLERLRVVLDHDHVGFDLTWRGSFPAILEQPHLLLDATGRPTLDAQRFAQLGSWEGVLHAGRQEYAVTPDRWLGNRDRSWGIRPSGDPDPAGRAGESFPEGFWWVYCTLRFDSCAVVLIVQEEADGHRTLNDASRVLADGTVEQLGWPRFEIDYASGTRHPERARVHLATPAGEPLVLEVATHTSIPLHVGCGYRDADWSHGQWKGRDWSQALTHDLTSDAVRDRLPWGVVDHVATAALVAHDGSREEGAGMFEHGSIGRHDPTGFAGYDSVAPDSGP